MCWSARAAGTPPAISPLALAPALHGQVWAPALDQGLIAEHKARLSAAKALPTIIRVKDDDAVELGVFSFTYEAPEKAARRKDGSKKTKRRVKRGLE